jgi:hypothetical protein
MNDDIIDDIDHHIGQAGSIERAAIVPGMYLAWCVNLQLVSKAFHDEFERDMLRLRYRDLTPAAFFIRATGGRLTASQLSERGRLFAMHYYSTYCAEALDPAQRAPLYGANDDWNTYDAVAPGLTKAYYDFADAGHKVAGSGKHWWQVWR